MGKIPEFVTDDDDATALQIEENGGVPPPYTEETLATLARGQQIMAEQLANPPKRVNPNAYSEELIEAIRRGGEMTMRMLAENPGSGLDDETLAAQYADGLSQ